MRTRHITYHLVAACFTISTAVGSCGGGQQGASSVATLPDALSPPGAPACVIEPIAGAFDAECRAGRCGGRLTELLVGDRDGTCSRAADCMARCDCTDDECIEACGEVISPACEEELDTAIECLERNCTQWRDRGVGCFLDDLYPRPLPDERIWECAGARQRAFGAPFAVWEPGGACAEELRCMLEWGCDDGTCAESCPLNEESVYVECMEEASPDCVEQLDRLNACSGELYIERHVERPRGDSSEDGGGAGSE